jgi:hypothetical protein
MSTYLNAYTPPLPSASDEVPFEAHLNTPASAYDLNFAGGPIPTVLQTDKLALVPFIPSLHAKQYYHGLKDYPELVRFMPYPKRLNESLNDLLYVIELSIRRLPVGFSVVVSVCVSRSVAYFCRWYRDRVFGLCST